MSKRVSSLVSICCFALLLSAVFLMLLFTPSREFSEAENRMLAQRPTFSIAAVADGSFMTDFETYLTDQFPFRDRWMDMKAACERLLLKKEYNGYYLCGDTLIKRFDEPDRAVLTQNLKAVNALAEHTDAKLYFALIPGAAAVWSDKLPPNAPSADMRAVIAESYAAVRAETVDIDGVLTSHADEPVFYRTDHHWTTLGAYYGYTAIARAVGFEPIPLEYYKARTESENFCGTAWSGSGVHWLRPDAIVSYVPEDGVSVTNYPSGEAVEGKVYERSFLEKKDKYSLFYGGNTPRLVIRTGRDEAPRLLIVRDSYTDCMSPFLFPHYSEIHQLDLRYYRLSLEEYICENRIDQVLVCYAVSNFTSDRNVVMMSS